MLTASYDHMVVWFDQAVGITTDELEAAQKWNGPGILELLKSRKEYNSHQSIRLFSYFCLQNRRRMVDL